MRGLRLGLNRDSNGLNVRWPACQDETLVAIAAIDIALFIDFEPDARVAERRAAWNVERAITGDAAGFDGLGFGCVSHASGLSNPAKGAQLADYSPISTRTSSFSYAFTLTLFSLAELSIALNAAI